jgi:hypothetical protein
MKTLTLPTTKAEDLTYVECKTCLFDASIVKIHEDGECEMCKLQEQQRNQAREPWDNVLARIKKKGKGRKYDALVGISGGEDSSVLAYLAVKVWNLRVLVLHINNRTNRPQATNNIQILRDKLNINFIEYYPAKDEYDELTDSLLKAGVPDADIANDIHMSKLTWDYAKHNGIKCTLNGHSYREEGSSPKAWSFLDTEYLKDIYKKFTGKDLYYYETLSIWDQVHSALSGMLRVSPYHYDTHNRPEVLEILKSWGWQDYGGKHLENGYTAWVGCWLLPNKFGIDKRRTYLSAHIREGKMTKEYAKEILSKPMQFDLEELGERKAHILHLVDSSPLQPRSNFKQTDYKKLRPIFWVLMKLKIFPVSAFNKYCK